MKDRTLLHLLLVTGKKIMSQSRDKSQLAEITEVLDTLQVSKDRGQPFRVLYVIHRQQKVAEFPADKFSFHLRGDIASRIEKRRDDIDLRASNEKAALQIWSEILGEELTLGATDSLPVLLRLRANFIYKDLILWLFAGVISGSTALLFDQQWIATLTTGFLVGPISRHKERSVIGFVLAVAIAVFSSWPNDLLLIFALIGLFQSAEMLSVKVSSWIQALGLISCAIFEPRILISLFVIVCAELIFLAVSSVNRPRAPLVICVVWLFALFLLRQDAGLLPSASVVPNLMAGVFVSLWFLPRFTDSSAVRLWSSLAICLGAAGSEQFPWLVVGIFALWITASIAEFPALHRPVFVSSSQRQ
jgi:hypothetical protein